MMGIGSVSAMSEMIAKGSLVYTSQRIHGENIKLTKIKPQEKFGIKQAALPKQKENKHQFSKDSLTKPWLIFVIS